MKNFISLVILLISLYINDVNSFKINKCNSNNNNYSRMLLMKNDNDNSNNNMKKLIGSFVLVSTLMNPFNTYKVNAAVGEGDLPDGALAFSKLLKYQKEWTKLTENMKGRTVQMDDKEIVGTKLFLKQLANEYNDMTLLSKSILDSTKAEKAKDIAKDFRTRVRDCDDAMTNGDTSKIIDNYPSTTNNESNEFL